MRAQYQNGSWNIARSNEHTIQSSKNKIGVPKGHEEGGTAVNIFTNDTEYVGADYTFMYSPISTHTPNYYYSAHKARENADVSRKDVTRLSGHYKHIYTRRPTKMQNRGKYSMSQKHAYSL